MTQGIDSSVIISDDCHDNRGDEPTGDETMERCLMNQIRLFKRRQEETRGSGLCCVM